MSIQKENKINKCQVSQYNFGSEIQSKGYLTYLFQKFSQVLFKIKSLFSKSSDYSIKTFELELESLKDVFNKRRDLINSEDFIDVDEKKHIDICFAIIKKAEMILSGLKKSNYSISKKDEIANQLMIDVYCSVLLPVNNTNPESTG